MKKSEENQKILRPKQETLNISGNLSYSEGNRAWNVIRLKQDILKEFPQLKERREKFDYNMIMHHSFKDLKKAIAEDYKIEVENMVS